VLVCGFEVKKANKILAENAKINIKINAFTTKLQAFMQNPSGRSNFRNALPFGIFLCLA